MGDVVTEDQMDRYIRRLQLGLRLLAHDARAHTVCEWSGLTPDQLATVRRRSKFNGEERQRGPSPSSFAVFFRSSKVSSQAALFASICRAVGVARSNPSVADGEKLCEAYEIYREWEPDSDLEFEHAVLLMQGAARGEHIDLVECTACTRPLLLDKLGDSRTVCQRCRRAARRTS